MNGEELAFLAIASAEGIGIVKFRRLMELFANPESFLAAYPARRQEPEVQKIVGSCGPRLLKACLPGYRERLAARLEQLRVTAVTQVSLSYPQRLRALEDAPLVLYCRGDTALLQSERTLGIVGTRNPTRYGEKQARDIASQITRYGAAVVSGLARGIDACAHEGALEAGGSTLAVLGCGVDVAYPKENEKLYHRIWEQGLVLSEYIPGTEPKPGHFPVRNRIIAGLSDALAVIEAGEKSGTNITVEYALRHNLSVFAVPGNVDSRMSVSTNRLIRDGAVPLLSAVDVAESLGWEKRRESPDAPQAAVSVTAQESEILALLEKGPYTFDELSEKVTLDTPHLAALLGMLVLKGLAEQLPGRVYTKA